MVRRSGPIAEARANAADEPLLVFGGPYSNLEATQALLAWAADRGIAPDRILCTGDIVAYGADPGPTLDLIRAAGIRVIMGNCEEALAAGSADCGCGYAEGSACDRLAAHWYGYADRRLDAAQRAWMRALPRELVLAVGGKRLLAVHGGTSQINRFVFASTPAGVKRVELARIAQDGVIAGHSGLPFSEIVDGRLWHNAGAIGMPANDGTPRLWFSLLRPEGEGVRIEHRALAYEHAAAAAKMRRAALPQEHASALETGLWPSLDVLPPAERAASGRPLAPGSLGWAPGQSESWPPRARPAPAPPLDPRKFQDPARTLMGKPRAQVAPGALRTLWFNTGTLCNLACAHCYIESSPGNDRLAYLE